jgi:hypothetical protein
VALTPLGGAAFSAAAEPEAPARPPSPLDAGGPHIAALLTSGVTLDAEQWWRLYRFSSDALTPDSVLSRTHAGASAYDANGRVIGEIGEDYKG